MAVVELVLVIDFSIFTLFNGEIGTITEYYAVFVKGVNNLFATNVDPNITFQLVGIYVLEVRFLVLRIRGNLIYQRYILSY